jgi:cell wall-associated NlpC family hydrolase
MARSSYNVRQFFGAALLATAVLALCSARPPLLLRDLSNSSRLMRGEAAERPFELLHPTKRDSIVTVAWALVGTPYEMGGTTLQRGFDCSGLVRFVLAKVHMTLPRTASQQARLGAPIGRDRLLPGDLLTFGRDSVSHIGIYVGEGKFVHASSIAGRVIVSRVDRPTSKLIRPLSGARRLLALGGPAHAAATW